jgi:hypothetical protein
MASLPYYFKNTTTISTQVPPLPPHALPEPGDLIVIPGHVMVIADLKNHTLLEARGYPHGYGKVQELPLEKVFKDIATYEQLLAAYRNKKTVYRIDREGNVRDTIQTMKILRVAGR